MTYGPIKPILYYFFSSPRRDIGCLPAPSTELRINSATSCPSKPRGRSGKGVGWVSRGIRYILIIGIFFISACGKKKNIQLAQSYYRLSMLELSEDVSSDLGYKKALNHIDKALACDKKPEYLALKATILFKLNQTEESLACFKLSLGDEAIDPLAKPEVLNNYACVLAQQGKCDEACKIWQNLLGDKHYLTPEVALVNLGKVYVQTGDYNKAKDVFTRAITLEPGYLDAHYYRALAAYQTKDYLVAKNETKTVLFLEPTHQGAQELDKNLGALI